MPILNDRMLKTLRPPDSGKLELTDGKVPGLQFRLTAHGHAGWRVGVTWQASGARDENTD